MFDITNSIIMSSLSLWHIWGLGSLVFSLSSIVYFWCTTTSHFPASVPWAGVRDETFSKLRSWIRELFSGLATVHEGYFTYNKDGKPFVLLDTAGRTNVILPKEQVRWLVGQPDHVLNSRKVINTKFAIDYLIPHIRKELDEGMSLAIRRDLTRNLGRTQKVTFEAIRERVDRLMGMQESWHEVSLSAVLEPVVAGVSYRMLVGEEMYQHQDFMRSLENFGSMLGIGSLLIGQFMPSLILPAVGFSASLLVRIYRRKALTYLVPEVEKRLSLIQRDKTDPNFTYKAPLDILHWSIMTCPDATAAEMAALVLSLALGATHTSISILTATFLDLLGSPDEMGFYEALAKEATAVFQNEEDYNNLASLHKLSKTDSAIRESSRRNPLTGRGVMHEVMQKNGVTLPNGQKIPQGAWLGISLTGISQDSRYYQDALTYDPFRFDRARTEIAMMEKNKSADDSMNAVGEKTNHANSTETVGEKVNVTDRNKLNGSWLSTTAEDFGTFGFGRHSCPGRWFASHVMKLTLSYIALKYEIQHLKNGRPTNYIIGDVIVPPHNVKITVRRRISV